MELVVMVDDPYLEWLDMPSPLHTARKSPLLFFRTPVDFARQHNSLLLFPPLNCFECYACELPWFLVGDDSPSVSLSAVMSPNCH